jgi:hypothetical protein
MSAPQQAHFIICKDLEFVGYNSDSHVRYNNKQNMIRCTVCNNDYNDGELERHLIMYHITTNENIAKYITYLEERINTLEAAQPRPKMEP